MPESVWPIEIKFASLPSALFCVLFLWNGMVYVFFSKLPWQKARFNLRHLFFGLTSLALAFYAFSTFNLYSVTDFPAALFWQKMQFFTVIPVFIFFNLFSARFLKLSSYYLNFIMPLITALFLPFIFIDEVFLSLEMAPKYFALGRYSFSILEASQGPIGITFLIWGFLNLAVWGVLWFRAYFKEGYGYLLPSASIIFLLTTINDVFVTSRVYTFLYLLELGSLIAIIAMAIYLFRDYAKTSRRFYEQKNRLEIANQEIRFLVNAISHDFSAPLLSINGFISLISKKGELSAKELQHYLKRIEINAQHIQTLLQDLATYLRIGRVKEERVKIDLPKLMEEIQTLLALAERYPLAQVKLKSQLPPFKGSATRLKQVLVNLIQNSLKYGNKENLRIEIEVSESATELQFAVTDNGPGIPKEIQGKIFEAFFRNHAQPVGSGLGLAIVKKVIEGFSGKVWVDPQYRQGARICFTWPR